MASSHSVRAQGLLENNWSTHPTIQSPQLMTWPAPMPLHMDLVSAVLSYCSSANGWLTSSRLWKVPPTPRPSTIPLPGGDPRGSRDSHNDNDEGDDVFQAREAGISGSLAAAKPENINNGTRSGVSFFLPHQKSSFILTGLAIVRQPSRCLGFGGLPRSDRGL